MSNNSFFSICIPTYEMNGVGLDFLKFNFKTFKQQTFQNFQVVVSDHSQNDDIKNLCLNEDLNVKYIKNENDLGNSSANINNAILNADGDWIKIIFQDDFLYGKDALENLKTFIDTELKENDGWVVTGSEHTTDGMHLISPYEPRWSLEAIYSGHNTISSPSVLSFKNKKQDNILFDKKLLWLMDIDYYYNLYLKYGDPKIYKDINVVNRVWDGSVTSRIMQDKKDSELKYFKEKLKIS